MDKEKVESLIEKYINGTCSPDELLVVENFLNQVQTNNTNWDDSLFGSADRVKKNIYQSILKNIRQPEIKYKKTGLSWRILKIAASIALMVALSVAAYLFFAHPREMKQYTDQTITTSASFGQTKSFSLVDGTKVTLNSGSALHYPQSFNTKIREVSLEGEAYFDVAHNAKIPFIVKTPELDITVIGTEFNVCAYLGEDIASATLVNGKVALRVNQSMSGSVNDIILKPLQRAVYTKNSNTLHVGRVNTHLFTSWKEGLIVFSDTPLKNVIQRLHRKFNVDFEFLNTEIEAYVYTVTFENEPLEKVLQILAQMTPITYSVSEGKVTLDIDIERKNNFKIKL